MFILDLVKQVTIASIQLVGILTHHDPSLDGGVRRLRTVRGRVVMGVGTTPAFQKILLE